MMNTSHIFAILILELRINADNHLMATRQVLSHLQSRGNGIVTPWFHLAGLRWNPEQNHVAHTQAKGFPIHLIGTRHKSLCLTRIQ